VISSFNGGAVITGFFNSAKRFERAFVSGVLISIVLQCLAFEHVPALSSTAAARGVDVPKSEWPAPRTFQSRPSAPSLVNIEKALRVVTQEPHPLGSVQQKKLARWMVQLLRHWGWKTEEQRFTARVPIKVPKDDQSKEEVRFEERTGRNVIASRAGPDDCAYIIGGHYDSKYFPAGTRFVGANDGGSSTALMLELARLWMHPSQAVQPRQKSSGTWLDCDIVLAFFDGEEAFLPEWSDGERVFGVRDNLYGSRDFVNRLPRNGQNVVWKRKKPIKLLINIDMIGHKKQNLFITEGSEPLLSEQLVALRGSVQLRRVPLAVEDDHLPFLRMGVPLIHIIDWTNLAEWHTKDDTLDIVSAEKIAAFLDVLMKFSERKRP
jgi:glutaminyl-peptide cyclotransferase